MAYTLPGCKLRICSHQNLLLKGLGLLKYLRLLELCEGFWATQTNLVDFCHLRLHRLVEVVACVVGSGTA